MQTEPKLAADTTTGWTLRGFVSAWTLAMLLLCSALQATHLHRTPLAGKRQSSAALLAEATQPGADTECLLCVTAHSALPVHPPCDLHVLIAFREIGSCLSGRLVPTNVEFIQFTRPPPELPSESATSTVAARHCDVCVHRFHFGWFEQDDVPPGRI